MKESARKNHWTAFGRTVVVLLGSTSIGCLLADFYGVLPMRLSTPFIFLPSMAGLAAWALHDRYRGNGQLAGAVWLGLAGGLLAAVAYDIFRLPFVFATQWGIASVVPPLNLFKVFPGFGAMILGQPTEQSSFSGLAQGLGWAYHFSNGATFGVMYCALIGHPARRHWLWAVLFALGLELGMLLTPYAARFQIPITTRFVLVTVAAHGLFGVVLGLSVRGISRFRIADFKF